MAWKRLPGTARRYENTVTGQVLTDRQYRKLGNAARAPNAPYIRTVGGERLLPQSLPSRAPIQQVTYARLKQTRKATARYHALVSDYVAAQASKGVKIGKREAAKSQQFLDIIADLTAVTKKGTPYKVRQKRALIALGRRQGVPYKIDVGQSNVRYQRDKITGKWSLRP